MVDQELDNGAVLSRSLDRLPGGENAAHDEEREEETANNHALGYSSVLDKRS